MRSIPFDVICLAGMNSDAYPRRDRLSGFSVMETRRRAGDRSQRQDDQYLFLESLISAGKYLIISHIGQSAEDNSDILPSGLVSELLDYLDRDHAQTSAARFFGGKFPGGCEIRKLFQAGL
jgi:exodeoxyribonuclease V gamma subunit